MPSSGVLTLTDPDQHQAAVSRTEHLRLVITAPGNFRSDFTFVDLHNVALDQGRLSLPRIIRGSPKQEVCRFHFPTLDNSAPAIFNGVETPRPYITFSNPGADFVANVPANNRWGRISLSLDTLVSTSNALLGDEIAAPKTMDILCPPPALMVRLQNVHLASMRLAATTPEILEHAEVARAIEQELLRALIACLADPVTIKQPTRGRRSVLQRFHEVIEANQYEPLYLPDLCASIGVPERTLRHACTKFLGTSPHRYLKLRRMNLVRRALALADHEKKTVTSIANDHGFAELGRFAAQYRTLYGESPSATLRRAPHDLTS